MNVFDIINSFHDSTLIYAIIFLLAFVESVVLVGLIFPGTTLMIFIGYLVSRDQLSFVGVIVALSVGGIIGDVLSFYLGRSKKRVLKIIERFLNPERLEKAELFFKKYGASGVMVHRFIGPLRPLLPFAAGVLKMERKIFIFIDIISNIASALFYVSIGVFLGDRWRFFLAIFIRYEKFAFFGSIIILALYYLITKKLIKR